jgi:hypothetical protein
MTDREALDELEKPVDRTAFPIAIDREHARDRATARHHGKALAFGDIAQKLREMLIGFAGADRSIHDRNLVNNTRLCNMGQSGQ